MCSRGVHCNALDAWQQRCVSLPSHAALQAIASLGEACVDALAQLGERLGGALAATASSSDGGSRVGAWVGAWSSYERLYVAMQAENQALTLLPAATVAAGCWSNRSVNPRQGALPPPRQLLHRFAAAQGAAAARAATAALQNAHAGSTVSLGESPCCDGRQAAANDALAQWCVRLLGALAQTLVPRQRRSGKMARDMGSGSGSGSGSGIDAVGGGRAPPEGGGGGAPAGPKRPARVNFSLSLSVPEQSEDAAELDMRRFGLGRPVGGLLAGEWRRGRHAALVLCMALPAWPASPLCRKRSTQAIAKRLPQDTGSENAAAAADDGMVLALQEPRGSWRRRWLPTRRSRGCAAWPPSLPLGC